MSSYGKEEYADYEEATPQSLEAVDAKVQLKEVKK
jgi:hypothetical protein